MSYRYRRHRLGKVLILLALIVVIILRWHLLKRPASLEILEAGVAYTVERVVNGNTLLLGNTARVRLLGIDTPEMEKLNHAIESWGPEATAYTERCIDEADGLVRLEFDKERIDPYNRVLAYVYAGDHFLNEALVREGLAFSSGYRISAAKRRTFRKAEDEAKAARRGIWSVVLSNP